MAEELDYKSVLRKSLNLLLEDLDPVPILDYFIQEEFLTQVRIRDIQELPATTEKNRAIVNSLGGKGLKGYRKFKRFLRQTCQGHLADCLEKFEKKVKAEQSSKPRVNSTMQEDGLNAGGITDSKTHGANSRGQAITQGGQNARNISGGKNTTYGPLGQGQPQSHSGFQDLHALVNQPSSQTGPRFPQSNDSYVGRNQMGANKEGVDVMDAAPIVKPKEPRNQQESPKQADLIQPMNALQMSQSKPRTFRQTIVDETKTNYEDIADGRVLDVDEEDLENVIVEGEELQSGSTGKVYRSKEIIKEWGFRIVVKKIPCTEVKLRSIVNEVVAARMKHQGIVPLLAKTNYKDKDHAYFVFPYMEKGDLMNAIREDMERITKQQNVHMSARQRVLILYQIACAMCFIHTPVKGFRGPVFHGDVTTRNIVLDEKYDARLLDFGVARELELEENSIQVRTGELIGTPGYPTVSSRKELSPKTDCESFGVVILELLTGEVPKGKRELKKEPLKFLELFYPDCHKSVWAKNQDVYEKLKELAGTCLKGETDSKSLTGSLYEILRDVFNFELEGKGGETTMQTSKERCSLCIINWAVEDLHNLRLDGCVLEMKHIEMKHISPHVCVPCMRNSYLNPIMCRRCRSTIHTNIGNSWGAILVAGFAEDEDGMAFKNDVKSMEKILTSKYPLVFGLDPANVISISMEELKDAVEELKDKAYIATILVYYSGHYQKEEGFTISGRRNWKIEEFSNDLKPIIKQEIVLVMDCCEAGSIDVASPKIILQMNASRPDEKSIFNKHGSIFTKGFIQATKPDQCPGQFKICESYKPDSLQKGFISLTSFFHLITKHIAEYCKGQCVSFKPTCTVKIEKDSHFYIGYHIAEKLEIKFDLEDGSYSYTIEDLPCKMGELRNLLLEKILKKKFEGAGESERNWSDYWKDNEKGWQNFSDAIRVSITKGPHDEHKRELINIPQVVDAWNKKFELNFGFRDVENIEKGNVGEVLKDIDTQQVLEMFQTKRDHYKDCFEVDRVDEQTKITILYETFLENLKREHSVDQVLQWLKKTVLDIFRNQNLKQAKKLIITIFPELRNERFPLTERFLMMEIPKAAV